MASMAAQAPERTVSGKAIALGFVAVGVAVVLSVLLISPGLQRQADDLLGAERDVLDVGELEGVGWVVASEFDDGPACVVTEFEGREAARACAGGPLGDMAVAAPGDGAYLFTGTTAPDVPQVRVELSDGQAPLPRVHRPGASSAGYYATTVPAGVAVERVVGLDLDEHELVVRTCYGPLATADGVSSSCSDETTGAYSGGQG
jgi:hypothetical protein